MNVSIPLARTLLFALWASRPARTLVTTETEPAAGGSERVRREPAHRREQPLHGGEEHRIVRVRYRERIGRAGVSEGEWEDGGVAGGLWIGALEAGKVRVSASEYSDDFAPGRSSAESRTIPRRPSTRCTSSIASTRRQRRHRRDDPRRRARRLQRGCPAARGAPRECPGGRHAEHHRRPDAVERVQRLRESVSATFRPAASAVGVEVQQTTWALRPGGGVRLQRLRPLKIINRRPGSIADMHISFWSDPDLGGFQDDLIGCDTRATWASATTPRTPIFSTGAPRRRWASTCCRDP